LIFLFSSPSNVRSSPTSLYYTYILELNSVIYRERKKQKWDQARITHRVRVAKQAEQLRIDDNNCFKKDHFEVAIDAYTKVLLLLRVSFCFQQVVITFNNFFRPPFFSCLCWNLLLLFIFFIGGFKAITLHPNVLMYWTNRALFHLKLSMIMEPTLCYCSWLVLFCCCCYYYYCN